jgi:hypothetical protein
MEVEPCPHPHCDMPAEILDRVLIDSTDEPVEHVRLLCVSGHRFFMPPASTASCRGREAAGGADRLGATGCSGMRVQDRMNVSYLT